MVILKPIEYVLNYIICSKAIFKQPLITLIIATSRPYYGGKTFDEYLEGFKKEVEVLKKT
jgi:hypothetical protein